MRVFCTKNGRSPAIEILNDAGTAIFICVMYYNHPQWK